MLYEADDEMVMLSSVDFITPVVDDPYKYGQIAAANALSDIFAMGGEAKSALNILMWDNEHFDSEVMREILRGGLNKITESGAFLLGGHTIKDREQKYGLSVNGVVPRAKLWRNHGAQIGDVLVLTKALGSGILSTAIKAGLLQENAEVVDSMAMLNLYAARIAREYEIHACTDITGFGLIGHAFEMLGGAVRAKDSNLSFLIYTREVPLFSRVLEFVNMGIVPGGSYENKAALQESVRLCCDVDDIIYYDSQTSGGLLFALPFVEAKEFVYALRRAGMERATIIGEVIEKQQSLLTLG